MERKTNSQKLARGSGRSGNHGFYYIRRTVMTMDISVFTQLIASLGFPIAAYAAMFWLVNKQNDQHREEIEAIRGSLDANTAALADLRSAIQLIGGVKQ